MPMTEDLTAFFDADEHGTEMLIDGDADAPVVGIFDRAYDEVAGMGTSGPRFTCAAADVATLTEGTSTLVDGADTYLVRNVRSDGTGVAVLLLEVQ